MDIYICNTHCGPRAVVVFVFEGRLPIEICFDFRSDRGSADLKSVW